MKKSIYSLSIICLIIDQITKFCIIKLNTTYEIFSFLYIDLVFNTGSAFSMFSGYTLFLAVFSIFVLIYIDRKLLNNSMSRLEIISYSLLIGGTLGNLFDRLFRGKVVDFIRVNIYKYTFPIFNIADTFIVIGTILIIYSMIKGDGK